MRGDKKKKVKVFTNKQKTAKPEHEYIKELQEKYNEKLEISKIKSFKDFPLSFKTQKGLKDAGYKVPTAIQKEAIMLGLRGNDILGAAQTGSGKTLAFLIPMLEKLFCLQWTGLDGLGALVITPTRELALQIFETLKKVGSNHGFSCGLIIGGKDLKFERKRIDQCNIIICTPGRLLQHMDENPLFDASSLQILILDEADRCMDMGFKAEMNAIIENLPTERQTFLFSATQTKSVKDLARLNLKDPSYVAVHQNAQHSTPDSLEQSYSVCEMKDKVAILWSFIKMHLKKKVIVFLSTCKQVKFIFDIFSKMRPGVPLLALYGRMHQLKRIKVYEEFSAKSAAVLFATDIVARGLDFPEVHWVVQVDCPEDADTYIHRVGRTARYHKGGESFMLLMPSELPMLKDLEKKKIPISEVKINPVEIKDPAPKMESFLADNPALQYTAKRAFVTYLKSLFKLKRMKHIFDNVEDLNLDAFAISYGLSTTPRLNFLKKAKAVKQEIPKNPNSIRFDDEGNVLNGEASKDVKKESVKTEDNSSDDGSDTDEDKIDFGATPSKYYQTTTIPTDPSEFPELPDELIQSLESGISKNKKPLTKIAEAKKMLKEKGGVMNKKIKFDEEGEEVGKDSTNLYESCYNKESFIEDKLLEAFKKKDELDKQEHREHIKRKHREQKKKLKEQKQLEKEADKVDDFGESESEEDVDLSWLPDPKKIYGNSKLEDDEEETQSDLEGEHSHDDEERHSDIEEEEHSDDQEEYSDDHAEVKLKKNDKKKKLKDKSKNKKRKLQEEEDHSEAPKKKQKKMDKIKKMTNELTVNEAEELALMLLQK